MIRVHRIDISSVDNFNDNRQALIRFLCHFFNCAWRYFFTENQPC